MIKFIQDIELAEFLINPNKTIKEFEKFYNLSFKSLYAFTTENLSGYYNFFDFKDKKYLTVTGSGDQTLNAILKGCKEIDCFDINSLQKYYQILKIQAIKDLDYYEFLMFFTNKITKYKVNDQSFNKSLFNKIKLNNETKRFWDILYDKSKNIRKSQLFNRDEYDLKTIINANDYLKEDNYYLLKNILLKNDVIINYYDISIKELPKLEKKYDIVNLSNIADYLINVFDKNLLLNFKKIIENIKLNDDGIIIANYFYDFNDNLLHVDNIYSKSKLNSTFDMNKFFYYEFEPVVENKSLIFKKEYRNKDSILCYKNNKK